ncbi:hypothetical protein BAUCODRAFT_257266 [Baudoinia panamericana UAMH 10762]|uniref:Uncharacterized protein n=1 Tax=Baudoinia panamericana (strain UAMH 10762) TaxID=717646 RepID=M2M8F6_BAUPA|nr:uncharacterized protein BAUCODRAFT_257266 [Baudoinia panamericana UAMH 10762]EMC92661.1 hypothetical protein BAUCODRAFT_257266 [Baudoinia panamericana UAMH 10762]
MLTAIDGVNGEAAQRAKKLQRIEYRIPSQQGQVACQCVTNPLNLQSTHRMVVVAKSTIGTGCGSTLRKLFRGKHREHEKRVPISRMTPMC